MLSIDTVEKVVAAAARAFESAEPRSVRASPDLDHYGKDSLRITLVFEPEIRDRLLSGNDVLNLVTRIQQDLGRSGEERFAFVRFLTESELEQDGEPES